MPTARLTVRRLEVPIGVAGEIEYWWSLTSGEESPHLPIQSGAPTEEQAREAAGRAATSLELTVTED